TTRNRRLRLIRNALDGRFEVMQLPLRAREITVSFGGLERLEVVSPAHRQSFMVDIP
ncbi:hypothetical protein, partial, partial [Parasitella parasitica]